MKILKLTSENVKKLKVVEITPDGNIVVISGANAAGKTSVLDSIWMTLAGKDAMKSNPDVIRHGEDTAKVIVNLGSEDKDQEKIIVTRTWTKDKTYLKIENDKGAKFQSPQAMLNKLTGKLSFDPLAFSLLPEKEQLQTLLDLTDISDDLVELDEQRKKRYDERTIVNRELNQLKSQCSVIPDMVDIPNELLDSKAIMVEFQEATNELNEIKANETELASMEKQKEFIKSTIKELKQNLRDNVELLEQLDGKISDISIDMDDIIEPDIESIQSKLANVEKTNELIRKKQEYQKIIKQLDIKQADRDLCTSDIEDIDDFKDELWSEANLPIDNLGFNDNGITYNQIPFSQCSAAERLRVSMSMAMAMNPEVRVIRITDGSLLDSANMKLIEEMADDNDFQMWVEVVQEDGTMGVYIEDGMVAMDNYHPDKE